MKHTGRMSTPPAPLEWHPAYRDRTWLLDWVEGRSSERPADRIHLAVVEPLRFEPYDEAASVIPHKIRSTCLMRHRAFGLAPYVGRPFRYEWFFADDELGRTIAGDVRVRHASPDYDFCSGPAEYTSDARNGHDHDTPVWP